MRLPMRLLPMLAITLLLAACGFHLRQQAQLPPGMHEVYLDVSGVSTGNRDFQRALAQALEASGATVVDTSGPGVARLQVPVASFSTNALTITGQGRISEYSVRMDVRFDVTNAHGRVIVPSQHIQMSREFTDDPEASIGRATQIEALEQGMTRDMVNAVMFRLQAAGSRPAVAASVN